MADVTLRIEGMHCGACLRRVTQALQTVPGAEVEEVRLGAVRVQLIGETAPGPLIDALTKAGFSAHQEL